MQNRQRGFSLIELLVVITIILIITAVALPHFTQAQWAAHETAALAQIGTIHTAQLQYEVGHGKYAASLLELGTPANFIPKRLAEGHSSRYSFTMQLTASGYAVQAVPDAPGSTRRTFYSDESRIVRERTGIEPAGPESPEVDR